MQKASRFVSWLPYSLLVSGGLFVGYLLITPDRLTWAHNGADSGDLLAAALTGGIAHPSGYPTYLILARLFQLLPVGTPYFRAAMLSAAASAAAAFLLAVWLYREIKGVSLAPLLTALTAALAWGAAPLVVSQAVIVEVYGLQSLFVMFSFWWVALLAGKVFPRRRQVALLVLAFLIGLGMGNHITLVFILLPVGVSLVFARRRGLPVRWLVGKGVLFSVGLLVYLYLPYHARLYPPVNWGNPQTWDGFWWLVTGKSYQGLLFSAVPAALVDRLTAWVGMFRDQFGLAGVLLGVLGAFQSVTLKKEVRGLLWWVFGVYSIFAIGYGTADSTVYLLPVYLVFAIWIALGAGSFWLVRFNQVAWGKILLAASLVYFGVRFPLILIQENPRQDLRAAGYAQDLLRQAPEGALILTQGDPDSFPLWYEHYGLRQRPDVAVIVLPLTRFPWYQETLLHTYPALTLPAIQSMEGTTHDWGEQIPALNPALPVCRTAITSEAPVQVTFTCVSAQ